MVLPVSGVVTFILKPSASIDVTDAVKAGVLLPPERTTIAVPVVLKAPSRALPDCVEVYTQ